MLVKTYGSTVYGVDAMMITIEVNISQGVGYNLVGLPDNAVKESSHRINAAFETNGFRWPGKKITVNMAPADIRKEGAAFDLPIALGILAASGQIPDDSAAEFMVMGELSLDGSLKGIRGALPIAIEARQRGFRGIILPRENAREAAVVEGLEVYGMDTLEEVTSFFKGTLCRRERPGKYKKGFGDSRCRRAQHNHGRTSRSRQNHACKTHIVHTAAAYSRRSAGNDQNTFCRRKTECRTRTYDRAPVPQPSPYDIQRGYGRRRAIPSTGRDIPRT